MEAKFKKWISVFLSVLKIRMRDGIKNKTFTEGTGI
jgi:hypothetical protein